MVCGCEFASFLFFLSVEENMEFPPTCVIKFTASWCGPCKSIHHILEECENKHKIPVVEVDIDEWGALADEYEVKSIPHMEFRLNGVLLPDFRINGASEEKIRKAFEKFSNLKKKQNQIVLPTLVEAELKHGRTREPE